MAKSSTVGTPRVAHQEHIQELIDAAIMADRAKHGSTQTGTSDVAVVDNLDGSFTILTGADNV